MTQGCFKTSRALIEMAVDVNVAKFPALEAGLMITGMVIGKRCVVVAASPPDFSVSDSDLLLLGQGG